MDINEKLDLVEYGLKYYSNEKTGKRINLLEYFSITDLIPTELAKTSIKNNRRSLALVLRDYDEINVWQLKPLNIESRLNLFHSIRGYELTPEDKIAIKEKLEMEEFPLMDGTFDIAARHFVEGGLDAISKEQVRNTIINGYNEDIRCEHQIKISEPTKEKVSILQKQL